MLRSFVVACSAPVPVSGASGASGMRDPAGGLRSRARPGAVLAVALALAAAEGEASGQAGGDPWRDVREYRGAVHCNWEPSEFPFVDIARGDFLGDGQEIGLALWNAEEGRCDIGREDGEGRAVQLGGAGGFWGGAHFPSVCRDPVSGRDHAVLHKSEGQYHDIEIWSLEAGAPKRIYSEGWGDGVNEEGDEWGIDLLVAADGACLWRERQRWFETFKAAMAALRVDRGAGDAEPEAESGPLPQRALAAATVREHLHALRGTARFEGAVYADAAARDSWFVVQILGGPMCDAEGAVLLLDRGTGQWKAIYDVAGGCSKAWYFPMRGMVVAGDRLYAGLCVHCSSWGRYADFGIDLRTNRAEALDWEAEAPGPGDEENPELHDPVAAAFPE